MQVDLETLEVKRLKVDLIMHYTNPLWVFCRIYKIIGKERAKWLIFGVYEKCWYSIFRKEC